MRAWGWSLLAVLPWVGPAESPSLPIRMPSACAVAVDVRFEATRRWGAVEWQLFTRQVERVWTPLGVSICWRSGGGRCDGIALAVTVTIGESPIGAAVPGETLVVGDITFDGDEPRNEIRLSLAGGRFLVTLATLGGRQIADWPTGIAERLLPAVMGLALAHELGHFLFRSKAHARAGLMAATVHPDDVARIVFEGDTHGSGAQALAARAGGCVAR